MFKRIVQRSIDGKYAIKRWMPFIGWEYKSLASEVFWWKDVDPVNKYCWTDDLDRLNKLLDNKETIIRKK